MQSVDQMPTTFKDSIAQDEFDARRRLNIKHGVRCNLQIPSATPGMQSTVRMDGQDSIRRVPRTIFFPTFIACYFRVS
jgi:hypothetical protein